MLNNKEQYNQFFSKSKESAYGKPGKLVESIAEHLSSGKALDLGAGDGRNAMFLAEKGFAVKAIDTSTSGIEKLSQSANGKGLQVETVVGDVTQWEFDSTYDVILAITLLQHLKTEDALRVLEAMQAYTNENGLNAISLFTNNGDRYRLDQIEDPDAFYPADGWLKEFYKDWEILNYEESEALLINRFREDGSPMKNVVAKILARKPAHTKEP